MVERISITLPKTLLCVVDDYVFLKKTTNKRTSRSSVIVEFLEKYIPKTPS